jgi:hypothetical protein
MNTFMNREQVCVHNTFTTFAYRQPAKQANMRPNQYLTMLNKCRKKRSLKRNKKFYKLPEPVKIPKTPEFTIHVMIFKSRKFFSKCL